MRFFSFSPVAWSICTREALDPASEKWRRILDAVLHRPTSFLCFLSLLLTDMERFMLSCRPILHGKEEDLPGCLSFLLGKRMKSLSAPFLRMEFGCVEE